MIRLLIAIIFFNSCSLSNEEGREFGSMLRGNRDLKLKGANNFPNSDISTTKDKTLSEPIKLSDKGIGGEIGSSVSKDMSSKDLKPKNTSDSRSARPSTMSDTSIATVTSLADISTTKDKTLSEPIKLSDKGIGDPPRVNALDFVKDTIDSMSKQISSIISKEKMNNDNEYEQSRELLKLADKTVVNKDKSNQKSKDNSDILTPIDMNKTGESDVIVPTLKDQSINTTLSDDSSIEEEVFIEEYTIDIRWE
ncbi:MAG: hypothetical protein ACRCTJ_01775 [Brevinema sp.]